MKDSLVQLLTRDIDRLQKELQLYTDEGTLWKTNKDIKNSAGNLAIHLIGNLNHFIGALLGNSGYIRQRDKEFNDKNISRKVILDELNDVKKTIEEVILALTENDLKKEYSINDFQKEHMSTECFLIHLYGHLNYHLGQINYHRRFLDKC
jgi:uncharacterized damage-inducible protein DinB